MSKLQQNPPACQPEGGGEVTTPLLYLNSNNTDENTPTISEALPLLTPYHRKQTMILAENVQKFIDDHGINFVGFLTLTFKDNVTDAKEAYRRFCSFRKMFLSETFSDYVLVKERQKRGAWHYHLLVVCPFDIRTGLDFAAVFPEKGRGDYSSASPCLRDLWKAIRKACETYGFGRSELAPIKTNAEGIACYVGKYIQQNVDGKNASGYDDKRVRLICYSRSWVRSNCNFAWNSQGAYEWRRKTAKFAKFIGCADLDQLKDKLGPRWAYHYQDLIVDVDDLKPFQLWDMIEERRFRIGYEFDD